jgi:hypothetical protein
MPEIDIDTDVASISGSKAASGNNELTNRRNKTRVNARFVDIVGEVKSIPDVLQPELARYVDGVEERVGAYVFGRNTIDIKQLSDGDNLIVDINGASAGIYRPFTSPNNSAPFEQIGDPINEPIVGVYQSTNAIGQSLKLNFIGQPIPESYKIKREKVNKLIFNVYAPNGLYARTNTGDSVVNVNFAIRYFLLDDDFNRVGAGTSVHSVITGDSDESIGKTIEVDLGSHFFVEWSVFRSIPTDPTPEGTVQDTVKLKSMYGLFDINKSDFGNVTIVQTKRIAIQEATSRATPEINAIATEMIFKYLGGGTFDNVLTTNTQAMQSLIAKCLDPKIGRLTVDDLDLDLLLQTQVDNETYYQATSAGRCSYSFDNINTSAQEVLFLIANTASVILWREGRVLKSWFERPQSVPEMVFTHRSKIIGDETWNRNFTIDYDGVEFPYIDDKTNSQEILTHPVNAQNPKKIDLKGFRGLEQATWRMLREFNKQQNQRITVDFTATAEGRFVRPSRLISVVKGTRVGQTGGYIMNVILLTVELSQEVTFSPGDDHFLVLKTRNGGTQTVSVTETANPRIVEMDFAPIEQMYFGNDELKTEFSFGPESRLTGQLMLPQTIDASDQYSTKITAVNYSDLYYQGDATQPIGSAFSDGFSNGFS